MAGTERIDLTLDARGREGHCTYPCHDRSHLGHDDLSPRDKSIADTIRTEKPLKQRSQTVLESDIWVGDGKGSFGICADAIKQVEFKGSGQI